MLQNIRIIYIIKEKKMVYISYKLKILINFINKIKLIKIKLKK